MASWRLKIWHLAAIAAMVLTLVVLVSIRYSRQNSTPAPISTKTGLSMDRKSILLYHQNHRNLSAIISADSAMSQFVNVFKDGTLHSKIEAAGQLRDMNTLSANETILYFYKQETDSQVCAALKDAISRVRDPGILPVMVDALFWIEDKDKLEFLIATIADLLDGPTAKELLTLFQQEITNDSFRHSIVEIFSRAGNQDVASTLADFLNNTNESIIYKYLSTAAAKMGDAQVVSALIRGYLRFGSDSDVTNYVLTAIPQVGNLNSADGFTEALAHPEDNKLCSVAMTALGKIGSTGAIDYLISGAKAQNSFLVAGSLAALSTVNNPDSLTYLLQKSREFQPNSDIGKAIAAAIDNYPAEVVNKAVASLGMGGYSKLP
jgi:HEAT repeat protein